MSDYIPFKDWDEMWWFLKNYYNFSCLNCHYGGNGGEPSRHLFCTRTIAMVDLNIMTLCTEWKSNKGKELKDYDGDCPIHNISDDLMNKLKTGELTVTELRKSEDY